MGNEAFDDVKLINLARFNFFASKSTNQKVERLFSKEKLSNEERNELLAFLETTRSTKPMNVKELKGEIFKIIGYTFTNLWGAMVNRSELEAIHKFIKGLKK